jgi:hypothetical protein
MKLVSQDVLIKGGFRNVIGKQVFFKEIDDAIDAINRNNVSKAN